MFRIIPVALFVVVLSGCSTVPRDPQRPANLNHLVFFKLLDPTLADELIADNERLLAGIPGVRSMFCGRHVDVGRESVDADYDVALYLGFETTEAYLAYVEHPDHQRLVQTWRPRIERLRVHDVLAEVP